MLSGNLGGAASAADVGTPAASAGCGKAPTLANGKFGIYYHWCIGNSGRPASFTPNGAPCAVA